MEKKILVVEDDSTTSSVIENFLTHNGYTVTCSFDGENAWELITNHEFDLILLDVMIPKIDGLELLQKIREDNTVPIIMLTALSDEYTQVVSYEHLIDDYVTKPFSPTILVKRVEAVLRRVTDKINTTHKMTFGNLVLDFDAHLVEKKGIRVLLTKKEYDIIAYLFQRMGKITTREQLLETIWGYGSTPGDRTLDSHIKNIRKKLPELKITTIVGIGYMIQGYLSEN
ncbi:response regulator transcription factor [Bacillus sp. 1P06AnD]|uniref:response regulator transcription factor n=1 Tax=Bacillus sp. 1P06AnD TaxID=3132208 RepID=UPI0039A348AF